MGTERIDGLAQALAVRQRSRRRIAAALLAGTFGGAVAVRAAAVEPEDGTCGRHKKTCKHGCCPKHHPVCCDKERGCCKKGFRCGPGYCSRSRGAGRPGNPPRGLSRDQLLPLSPRTLTRGRCPFGIGMRVSRPGSTGTAPTPGPRSPCVHGRGHP